MLAQLMLQDPRHLLTPSSLLLPGGRELLAILSPPSHLSQAQQQQVRPALAASSQSAVQTPAGTHQLAHLVLTHTTAPTAGYQAPPAAAPTLCQPQQLSAPAGAALEPQVSARTQDLVLTELAQLLSTPVVTPDYAAQDTNPGSPGPLPPAKSASGRSNTCSLLTPRAVAPASYFHQLPPPGDDAPAGPCGLCQLAALSTSDSTFSLTALHDLPAPDSLPAASTGHPRQTGMQSGPGCGGSSPGCCHDGLRELVAQGRVVATPPKPELEVVVEVVGRPLPLPGTRAGEQGARVCSGFSLVEMQWRWGTERRMCTKEGGGRREEGAGQGHECGTAAASLDTSQAHPPGPCPSPVQAHTAASSPQEQRQGPRAPGAGNGGGSSSCSRHVQQEQPDAAPTAKGLLHSCLAAALAEVGWYLTRLQCL